MAQCTKYNETPCKHTLCIYNSDFNSTDLCGFEAIKKRIRCWRCGEKYCMLRKEKKYRIYLPAGMFGDIEERKCSHYKSDDCKTRL